MSIRIYHGGALIRGRSFLEIQSPRKGRFESGVGINCTTHYYRARRYGKYVNMLTLKHDVRLSEDVILDDVSVDTFIQSLGPKNRTMMGKDIDRIRKRSGKVFAVYLVNLFVNNEIGGKVGLALNQFLVGSGVDASLYHQSGTEDWLTIHNIDAVESVSQVYARDVDKNPDLLELPRVKDQMRASVLEEILEAGV